jgi:catechol 2,3-dioxygenase
MSDYGVFPRGYRLPDETHVGRVRLQVSDLTRSLDYYQNTLGLRVLEQSGELGRRRATLGPFDADTALVELHERAGAKPVPMRGRLGLYHFAILLPDRPALGRFISHLASIGERAGASDHLVSEALYLRDPDGLGIEVYADRPRSSWKADQRQLVMATEPLDLNSVVRAAGGASFTGMPAGTTMGHVHLHVGDLDEAADFYHEGLGLDKIVWGYPGALFLSAGGYHHHLGLNTWAGPEARPSLPDEARLLEWELVLPSEGDVAAAAQSLDGAGHASSRDAAGTTVADPWGTTVRIMAGR